MGSHSANGKDLEREMGSRRWQKKGGSKRAAEERALNAFDLADEGDEIRGKLKRAVADEGSDDDGRSDLDSDEERLNGEVRSEDDEEIDSDEALGSDDDDLRDMLDFSRRQKRKKQSQQDFDFSSEGEDEDPEEYDNIDDSELFTLSQVWDMNEKNGGEMTSSDSEGEESDSESVDEDEDEDDLLSDSDDEVDAAQLEKLHSKINSMGASVSNGTNEIKRQRLAVNNIAESEFSLPTSGSSKISLGALAGAVDDGTAASKSALSLLDESKNEGKSASLAVPLPRRIQQRHDRAAALELANEQVDRWSDTVKANREAEHLQFPINPEPALREQSSYAPLKASTELEKKVDQVLKKSKLLDEKALANFEELAPSKLSVEEVRRRRNELRLARELMFREEQKAKRIKKIKSKSYRRVHKKEREREKQLMGEDESDAEDHDVKRARERMSLKHKTTSKWAKSMVEQGFTKDRETRAEMEEMLRKGETLRRKIEGTRGDGSDSSEEDNEFFDDDAESEVSDGESTAVTSKLLNMKFMKEAQSREKKENEMARRELQRLRESDDLEELSGESAPGMANEGRRSYAPSLATSRIEADQVVDLASRELEEEEQRSTASRLETMFTKGNQAAKSSEISGTKVTFMKVIEESDSENEAEDNPWLTGAPSRPKQKSKAIKATKKMGDRKSLKDSSQEIEIDMNQTLDVRDPLASDGDDDKPTQATTSKPKLLSFKQKELVKRAFAGDDVVNEFQTQKKQKIRDDEDQVVDVTMPGWGAWAGNGASGPKKRTKVIKGLNGEKRKDSKLKNVIINEKVVKKAAKYSVSAVPFPYENREQYERALRMPIGQEWSSRATHQKLTKPRIMVKQGVVIDPLKKPLK
ncbi:U3 small nucleolar RNA-associated protein 14 [Trichomonascus vanleenenianus]|uniref:Utp14p n=1 Tax=Trichomonascus vanleenenianus TaxID=2268995 RepID=UPI003ECA55E2